MQSFKFAILEFDYLLTNNVKAIDPVGSKNIMQNVSPRSQPDTF